MVSLRSELAGARGIRRLSSMKRLRPPIRWYRINGVPRPPTTESVVSTAQSLRESRRLERTALLS